MKVKDIMTTDVLMVGESATVADAIEFMKEKRVRSLIVDRHNDKDSYGIVTTSDIIFKTVGKKENLKSVKIGEIMTKPAISINSNSSIEDAVGMMADLKITHLPVIDKNQLVGIISNIDILYNL
ncbi:putative signal transduction protein with CBS domains [Thermodesulfobium narugense DSM 14796]|uniref:Putative signal transduction protein with CBS domains n=1 Tax=Thermodesulfobium narugense DSM 14796 TaxID=747365 RepID=M1E543_9BACT|nr:CBS domain-containing protein [Thermodesulfobium narugense]AEE14006.1 putative signal transduction protein with CBS domains [Thermodesulfobium narugense DSM 14796]